MEELLVIVTTLGQSAAYLCAAMAITFFGFYLILVQGRPTRPPAARTSRVPFDERMSELDFQSLDGGWDGTIAGRRLRISRVDDPTTDPPLVLELSTLVPTGSLIVGAGDPEQTAIRGSRHVGDSEFDPWFEVQGHPEEIALLTRDVRRALRNAARTARPRIERGWLTLVGPGHADVDALVAPLVAVASAIEASAELDPGLRVKRFAADPDSAVRMRCLEMLGADAQSAMSASVARSRLEDPDPIVRTLAAVLLKDAQRLVTIAKSPETPAGVRRRAARALMHAGSEEEKMAAATALAAGPEPLHSVAWELSEHLGNAAEPVLIQLIGSSNAEVARDAAGMLAKIGSIRAIPALREFQERTGGSGRSLKGSAKQELASAIQAMKPKRRSDAATTPLSLGSQDTIADHESPTSWRPSEPSTPRRKPSQAPAAPSKPTLIEDDDEPSGPATRTTGERRTPGSRTIRKR